MKVVNSTGKVETFEISKLIDSLIATFEIAQVQEGIANDLIRKTIKDFHTWAKDKPEITSKDIRTQVGKILEKIHPEASYIYKNFESII